jgi:Tfp pilus assembly protein PilF/peroxiredoxin
MKNLRPIKRKIFLALVLCLAAFFPVPFAAGLEGLQVGMKAPLFKLRDLLGKEVGLADQMDANVAVVVFWATWSDHSPSVLERLVRLYGKHKREKLSVLAVNVEKQQITPSDLAEIKKMVARLGITFPVLIDDGLRIFREYGVVAVPSTVVIDREGVIRGDLAAYPLAGREELFELIEAMAERREIVKSEERSGYQPVPRAVRYYNLARAMAGRGMSDAVDENLKRSISTDANFVLPLLFLSKLYRERAETEEAIEYQGSATITATFKAEKERYLKEAEHLVKKALELAPQSAPALAEAALILFSQGKGNLARERLLEAIKADPSYTPAHFFLAGILVREGRIKEGEEEFQRALRLNPLDHQGYYAMARAYEARGMETKAIEAYKKVLDILNKEREIFPYSYGR